MNLADYIETDVAPLWAKYQEKLAKGEDKAYIEAGDYVKVHTMKYFDLEKFELTSVGRKVAGQLLPVVASCKVAEDLWYTTVMGKDGKDYVLYDAEIDKVYKLHNKCVRCQDCAYLVDESDRYYCEAYDKYSTDIDICRETRMQFYDELAKQLEVDEDLVTQVVIDNFGGRDLDELSDEEYDDLIGML